MDNRGSIVQHVCVACVVVSLVAAFGWAAEPTTRPAFKVEVRPSALALNTSQPMNTSASCVLRASDGQDLSIVSAVASDPAIHVDLREEASTRMYVLTATVPPGYRSGENDHPRILVYTNSSGEPAVRIPLQAWTGTPLPSHIGWLDQPRSLIGKPAPPMKLHWQDGSEMEYAPIPGEVAVLMFVTEWCGHCNVQVPILERVRKDYTDRAVPNLRFLAIAPAAGDGRKVQEAVQRWELGGQIAVDNAARSINLYGVHAFPVVFLVGMDGTIQAVHGRHSNTPDHNGLDTLELDLHTEIDVLLTGGTRDRFAVSAPPSTQPAVVHRKPLPDRPIGCVSVMPRSRYQAKDAPLRTECLPGASVVFKTIIRNDGGRPLNIQAVKPAEGVTIRDGYAKDVPAGGLSVIACEVNAPNLPGAFSRKLTVDTNDPEQSTVAITLEGLVLEKTPKQAKAPTARVPTRPSRTARPSDS